VLTPEQQPPSQGYYYLADDKDSENSSENTNVHLTENLHQPVPSLLPGDPKYPPNNATQYDGNTQKYEYAFTFLSFRLGH
jgi:hypothetical protein